MSYETETLKILRQSLDEEDDNEASIISALEHHHKYLREYNIKPKLYNKYKFKNIS